MHFLDMPISSRLLYYELSIRADDDGFHIFTLKKITRMVGCSEDDLKMLIMKQFIIPFTSGVCVITGLENPQLHPKKIGIMKRSMIDEKSQLILEKNGMYTKRVHDVYKMDTEVRLELGKDRLEIGEDRGVGEGTPPKAADSFPYDDYRKAFIDCCPSLPSQMLLISGLQTGRKPYVLKKISVDEFRDVCQKNRAKRISHRARREMAWLFFRLDFKARKLAKDHRRKLREQKLSYPASRIGR